MLNMGITSQLSIFLSHGSMDNLNFLSFLVFSKFQQIIEVPLFIIGTWLKMGGGIQLSHALRVMINILKDV